MSELLVVCAHPHLEHSRVTRSLLQAALKQTPPVRVHELYARYPDYDIDVAAEQRALAEAAVVVWLHPIHWYSMPPLMKLWLDEVFTFGWAYGPGGHALNGKALWLATSTGGGLDAYSPQGHHRHAFDDFLLPYVQTARLTGMCWQPPLVLHAAHRASEAAVAEHRAGFVAGLERLRSALVPASATPAEDVPLDERPQIQAVPALAVRP